MTRIGLAYNQKPGQPTTAEHAQSAEDARPDEEPPSSGSATRSPHRSPATSPAREAARASDEFAEWDTAETIDAVAAALSGLGEVVRLEATPDFPERLRAESPDIVFNIAEGLRGPNRESHVPAICEVYGIPYSGSDPFTLSLCLDKARTKEALAWHGVPTAPFALVRDRADLEALGERIVPHGRKGEIARLLSRGVLRFPLFAKPVHEGSSKGITERNFCRDDRELREQVAFLLDEYAQPVLVEEYLPGAEFTCALLGNGDRVRVLPLVGMNFGALPEGALPIYGFEAKWVWDSPENPLEVFECPARIPDALRERIEETARATFRVLGCRDWARIDVRLDARGEPNVVEVNPLPGILPDPRDNSCFPKAARAAGMSYEALIQSCLFLAAAREGVSLGGAGARALAAAHG